MSGGWKTSVFFVVAVIIVCGVSNIAGLVKGRRIGREAGMRDGYAAGYAAPHPGDTIYIVDTSYHPAPAPATSKPSGTEALLLGTIAELSARVDSLRAVKPDTAFVEVPVPIETRTYREEDYEAQVSGWHPSLDWVKVYPKMAIVTQWAEPPAQKRRPRAGIGIAAGPGAFWTPQAGVQFGAGAVVGISVTF